MQDTKDTKKDVKFKGIIKNLYPSFIYDKVEDIPYELIKENDIKLLIFDMDNTLIDNKHVYSQSLKKWAADMKEKGLLLYILSNSPFGKVVQKIAKDLGMKYIYNAKKPFLKGFYKIQKETNIPKENILMIGDQLFTDVWGGNRFGIKTLFVNRINKTETFISRIKRPLEKIVLKKYYKNKGGM